ncbi:MAG: hypothetical protein LDL31_09980, partial [Prosthecobacter sp.]|nr:hypothetical protein [Prosthecobacter sp.]
MRRLLLLLLFFAQTALAQMANQPPVPHWIGLAKSGGQAAVELRFEQKGSLLKAILLLACGTDTQVMLNGRAVRQVPATQDQPALSIDLTAQVNQGANVLRLSASQPRVAALLELNGDLAAVRWIATDSAWTSPDGNVSDLGPVDATGAVNPFDLKKTFDAYNSWQLAKPGAQSQATAPADFTVPEGFRVQLVRSAQPGEDSWVAMAFDPQGGITLAREKKGLLRFDPKSGRISEVENTLLECRGLLHAHGVLYANANNTKALFRLRDADGDGQYEQKEELMRTEGGVGHGRNHIKLGPDGRIWIAHGNNVLLPSPLAPGSPLKNYAWDQVLPNPWDGSMVDGTAEMPAGHILAYDPATGGIELIAGGLRNPLDIAFNREGELFTYDADMERDVGAPWYMPTRVLHVVSGADFGWRRGTGRSPAWYVDTLPSVVDIGLSSPTGICFGYRLKFPHKYQDALFILDWSYGRIIAVHLQEKGASYTGTQETFISGRPLNVTDAAVGPDGALWFTTGGRGTQSGLYRIEHLGKTPPQAASVAAQDSRASQLRALRHQLERWHGEVPADQRTQALAAILPALEHEDRFIRHAARLALESLPTQLWKKELLEESTGWRGILGCLALARVGGAGELPAIAMRLTSLPWSRLSLEQQLASLRTLSVALARHGDPAPEAKTALLRWLEPLYPAASREANQELCRLLIRLGSAEALLKSLTLLQQATASEDLLFYPVQLRQLKDGWTLDARRIVFEALNRAEKHNGSSTYFKAIQDTRSEMAAALPAEQM